MKPGPRGRARQGRDNIDRQVRLRGRYGCSVSATESVDVTGDSEGDFAVRATHCEARAAAGAWKLGVVTGLAAVTVSSLDG